MRTYLVRIPLFIPLVLAGHLGAQTLSLLSGNGQIVYEQFNSQVPLVVQANDATGRPAAGVAVTWSITQGMGTLNGPMTMTDANGQAGTLFLATNVPVGSSFEPETVMASTSFGSVAFSITTVVRQLQNGITALPPSITQVSPPLENRSLTGPSGSTIPGGVVIKVFSQNGFQSAPIPNVSVRIVNYPDLTLTPPAMCNGPRGEVLTDATGTATCDLVITGPAGAAQFVARTGEFQDSPRVNLQITPGIACAYSLSGANLSIGANGGAGTVNVMTSAGCGWTAVSNASWVTVTGGASGSGNGTVSFTIAANTAAARTGTLLIAGQTYTVNQSSGLPNVLAIASPANLLAGFVGTPYSTTLAATGGQPPYTWTIASGSLPPPLTLNGATGNISGTPNATGPYAFNAKVTDNAGATQSQNFSILIGSSSSSGFNITNASFPNGVLGQPYQVLLTTSGGCVTPFSPSPNFVLSGGALPAGLVIQVNTDASRSIAGTPTASGTSNFSLTATEPCGKTATANFSIVITGAAGTPQMSVSSTSITFGVVAGSSTVPADQTINITATTGVLNYTAVLATSSGGNWLIAKTPTTGNTPGSITVGVANFSNLGLGSYGGTITLTSQASNSPVVIQVNLNVTSSATVTVTPTTFTVNQVFSSNPPVARLNIAVTSNGGPVHFTVSSTTVTGAGWLSISDTQGDTPFALAGFVNAFGLQPTTYTGFITITPAGGPPINVSVTLNVLPPVSLVATPPALTFIYQQGAAAPAALPLAITSTGASVNFSVSTATQSLVNWLFVDKANGATPANLMVSVNPAGLGPGPYGAAITLTPTDPTSLPITIGVTLIVNPAPPVIASVTNAASFAQGPISPGEFVTIFGSFLGPAIPANLQLNASGKVDTALGGTQVFFNNFPAPVVFTSSGQVTAIVPYELVSGSAVLVQVQYQGVRSIAVVVRVIDAVPGVFMADTSGQGAILNADSTPNSIVNGAVPNTSVSIYATGEGQTAPPGVDGMINPLVLPLPAPLLKVTVQIDGLDADVSYAGGAPGFAAGVMQVNAKVPLGVRRGVSVPVVVKVGTASSQNGVTLFIRP